MTISCHYLVSGCTEKKKRKKNYTSLHNLQLRAGFYMDLRYEFMLWEYSKNKQSK